MDHDIQLLAENLLEQAPGAVARWRLERDVLARSMGVADFGPLPRESTCLPFSDSWRDRRRRRLDWTIRVLILLKHAC